MNKLAELLDRGWESVKSGATGLEYFRKGDLVAKDLDKAWAMEFGETQP